MRGRGEAAENPNAKRRLISKPLKVVPMAKILLIEDSRPFLLLLKDLLGAAGHEVIATCSGAAAVRRLKKVEVDLVVTDLYMREPDGFDVVSTVRALRPQVPLVIITGSSLAGDIFGRNEALGAAATLQKPFSLATLLGTVESVLARHRAKPAAPAKAEQPATHRATGSPAAKR